MARSDAQPATASTRDVPTTRQSLGYLWRLVHLVRPLWGPFIKSVLLGVAVAPLGLAVPLLTKLFLDAAYPSRDVALMHVIVLGVLALSLASAVLVALKGYFTQVIAAQASRATGLMFFNHLQHLPLTFFETHRTGEITSRFQDVSRSLDSVGRIFETLMRNGIYVLFVPPILIAIHPTLALLSLATVPITTSVSVFTARLIRRYAQRSMEATAALSAFQVETLTNIRTFKSMGLERYVFTTTSTQLQHALRYQLTVGAVSSAGGVLNMGVRAAGHALFLWYAWALILRGELSIGSFFAFTAYTAYLTGPLMQVVSSLTEFQQVSVMYGRMFEYLDVPTEQEATAVYVPAAPITMRLRGDIVVRRVRFNYPDGAVVLDAISCHVPRGTRLAVVGPSGAGKSSLLRLLCRLDSPTDGSIEIDGTPVDMIPLASYRAQVSAVWQENSILRGTVRDNLTLGDAVAADARLWEVLNACQLAAMVSQLPAGLDSPIGEAGATLSSGQRQRLALARALVREAPILLLDEVTAHLDPRTEELLLDAIRPLLVGRTTVMVTHRISTAASADCILVLDGGRAVACGTHEELVRSCDLYSRLAGDTMSPQLASAHTCRARDARVAEA